MPPKRTTTPMIDAAIKALIAQGVATVLAEYEANRGSGNGDDSHDSGSASGNVMASKTKTMQDAIHIKKEYAGTLSLCNKYKFYHNGPCTVKCANCKRVGYLTRDCSSPAATNNQRTLTCYECGNQWHYKSDCPKLKNRNHGNQAGGTESSRMVYALGGGEIDQDLDNMEDDINA
ncbi:reverse transcriptase domain-containing protein [Tanacetum coccineum]